VGEASSGWLEQDEERYEELEVSVRLFLRIHTPRDSSAVPQFWYETSGLAEKATNSNDFITNPSIVIDGVNRDRRWLLLSNSYVNNQ